MLNNTRCLRSTALIFAALMIFYYASFPIFAEAADKDVTKISLGEAIDLALKNNLDIKISYQTVRLSEGGLLSAKSLNDINLSVNSNWSAFKNVSTSLFGGGVDEVELVPGVGATTTDIETWNMSSTLTERIPTGGQWTLQINTASQDSNNAFNTVNPYRSADVRFTMEQPLLKGFGFSFDVPQKDIIISRNNLNISVEEFKNGVMTTLYNVIGAYWNLVAAQKQLDVSKQSLDLAKDQLKRNKIQVEVGTMAPIEIVSAEKGVAEAEVDIISADAAVRNAQESLIQMLYAPETSDIWNMNIIASDEPNPEKIEVSLKEQMNIAFENRPDMKKRQIELESQDLNVKAASWDLLPDLRVTGSVTSKGVGGDVLIFNTNNPFDPNRTVIGSNPVEFKDVFTQITDRKFIDWTVGLNISFPLFNTAARGQHAQHKANMIMANVNLIKAKQDTVANVRRAIRDLETNYLRIRANEKARILAERQLEAERKKFDVGSSTNFQVLEYVRALAQARTQEVQARIDYSLSTFNLQMQTGVLLEKNNIFINPLEED